MNSLQLHRQLVQHLMVMGPCRLITTKTDYGISYGHPHRGDTLWLLAVDLIAITQKRYA